MADVLTVQDLEAAKKHDTFHGEVITGKAGAVAGGADIDTATNAVTGQVQTTLPKVLRDVGFKPASFTFVTGGTLGVSDADKCIYNPAPAGDDNWYSWGGNLPHDVAQGVDPTLVGSGYVPRTDVVLRSDLSSNDGLNFVSGKLLSSGIKRSLYNHLNDFKISALNANGIVNDGVFDCRAGLESLILTCSLLTYGATIYLPKGKYLLNSYSSLHL